MLAAKVDSGKVADGTAFKLLGDITIKTPVGTAAHRFKGVFDGDGHTITASLSVNSGLTAPFAYVTDATISHLHVDGAIQGGLHTAGIAGSVLGTSTITDCRVSAQINTFNENSMIVAGGLVGHASSSQLTVEGCVFDGSITATTNIDFSYAGAIVGWCNDAADIAVQNCVENGSYVNISHTGMNYKNGNQPSASAITSLNSYSLIHNWSEVKHGYRIIYLSNTFTPDFYPTDTYPTAGIVASATGLKTGDYFYAGSGEQVTINGEYVSGFSGYNFSVDVNSVTVVSGDYVLTMPQSDVYMSILHDFKGAGDQDNPYLIENEGDWLQFAYNMGDGNYNNKHYLLTNDIDIHVRAGGVMKDGNNDIDLCFSGTFDGGDHTITAFLNGGDYTCPFYKLNGGTIRNLHVDGDIRGGLHTSGLVGGILGNENANLIENCRVSASISCTSTHAGGFVGHASSSTTTLRGCLFDGKITGSNLTYIGYLVGWGGNSSNIRFENCAAYKVNSSLSVGGNGCQSDLIWDGSTNPATARCGTVKNTYGWSCSVGERLITLSSGTPGLTISVNNPDSVVYTTSHLTADNSGKTLLIDDIICATTGGSYGFYLNVPDGLRIINAAVNVDGSSFYRDGQTNRYNLELPGNMVNSSASVTATITSDQPFVGTGTEDDPYLIRNTAEWVKLAVTVSGGNSYAGKVFRMTQDIDCVGMSVGNLANRFSGIFDGDGHTLTFNSGTQFRPYSDYIAPFMGVNGATFRHLHTAGKIYSCAQYSGGIISQVIGDTCVTRLYDCHSSVTIVSTIEGDASNGGLVGAASNAKRLVIERCTFTGNLHKWFYQSTNCGGFVGWSNVPVTISESLFDPSNLSFAEIITSGNNFVRMADYSKLTLQDCYTTFNFDGSQQGTFVIDELYTSDGVSYEFVSNPDVTFNGRGYHKTGCWIRTTLDPGIPFDHWQDGVSGCFISDPWTRNGLHQLKDLSHKPGLNAYTSAIPAAETERTLWGVKYRYLSRRDYHFFISDEDRVAKGWTFEDDDNDANMVVYDSNNDASEITAVVGYDQTASDFLVTADGVQGVQIHNDLVGDWRAHTHLGIIAPHAFRNCTGFERLYFVDTDANNYNTLLHFDFMIDVGAFEGCTNFKELMLMQYTTRGDNHWDGLTPGQTFRVADDAFAGCTKLRISVRADHYQSFLSSAVWKNHQSRFIPYEATDADFTVKGVKYRWYRDVATEDNDGVKNDEAGKADMMTRLILWNGLYQQFSAASLLDTKDDCNVYYASVVGVDDNDIDSEGGTMKIYNDPGSYWNYKAITLNANAIAGNTHVRNIEFWQTYGRSENSFSDLKFVIPNNAFQGCSNLKELRLFYYVQDGDDRWMSLGPKDVIPGDNIFGLATADEMAEMNESQREAQEALRPSGFKILVSTELYPDFKDDPNWQPYLAYIEPVDYSPSARGEFSYGGMTYDYMTSPGGIMQSSQVVSQDVSWWTAPRIAIEVAMAAYTIGSFASAQGTFQASMAAHGEAAHVYFEAADVVAGQQAIVQAAEAQVANIVNVEGRQAIIDLISQYALTEGGKASMEKAVSGFAFNQLVSMGVVDKASGALIATAETLGMLTDGELALVRGAVFHFAQRQATKAASTLATQQAILKSAEQSWRSLIIRSQIAGRLNLGHSGIKALAYAVNPASVATSTAGLISSKCWGGSGTYNADAMNKGMRENILSNIHQVGLVGGGYVITTPQKNLVYHTYIKSVGNDVTNAVIYAGFDNDNNSNTSNRTMTFMPKAFRNKTNLQTVKFHDISGQSSNTGMSFLFTIPDSAFVGCTALTEFSTLLQTDDNGTRALGPENFILAGDSIFAGLDSTKFHIVIDPLRKQDYLDNESWAPLKRFFTYQSAVPAKKYSEYGANYAYAYEQNSIKKENKVQGHLIEHTMVTGPDDEFITGHQGAVKLCNDIGVYNNYQLDEVMAKSFKGNKNLRSVSFVDLYGAGAFGDCYTDLQVHIGDSAFMDCSNLADLDLLYMVTDGDNHIEPMTPQMITIGKGVFEGTQARIKMMPQQVAWFEADSSWAEYKDRFMPCVVLLSDLGIKKALKEMAYYDPANTGTDPAYWDDYADFARIGGAGFSWLDGKFTAQKDNIYSFADFRWFESVGLDYVGAHWFEGCSKLGNIKLPSTIKTIGGKAFNGCTSLQEIELPQNVTTIQDNAFDGCTNLNVIIVKGDTPASIGTGVFHKHEGLQIYVPGAKVSQYRTAWSEYASYIVGDDSYYVNKTVIVSAAGQLASKLGLTVIKEDSKIRYINGPYAKYDSLTVIGPLNGDDVAVLRHLMGANAWESEFTDGQLRYLNLWDADLKKDTEHSYNGYGVDEYLEKENWVGEYMFHNCNALETVILPKSVTEIGENTFQEAYGLKRIAVGRNTTQYTRDLLQDLTGIEELVFLTTTHATSESSDPWEAPIQQVYTLPSQLGDYMGDVNLTRQAQDITSPFSTDEVMWALANKGHFFPSEYLELESVENIFMDNTGITDLDEFYLFQNVKELEYTFSGMTNLETITLPSSIESIDVNAFAACTKLKTIHISSVNVIDADENAAPGSPESQPQFVLPTLAADAFSDLPADFRILVPKSLCKLYRTKWVQYADHINPDKDYSSDEIMTVTVTEPNTLAEKLGLTVTTDTHTLGSYGGDIYFVNSLKGDYSKIHKLKVIGPISCGDLSVLRHLSGYTPWTDCRNVLAPLEYIDLYDADLVYTPYDCASDKYYSMSTMEHGLMDQNVNNQLPPYAFLKAYNLKTLILPRTCTEVKSRAMQECEGLESLVIGDKCTTFNWNSLDDDAMLTRLYILSESKLNITTEDFIWRNLCNNYNPTFDAFYVRPSLYELYLDDDKYTGSSWQRTNNVSKGDFEDDESFAVFGSHAAATIDDLTEVYSVDGWFDNHTGVKDLTALGFAAISELRAQDMQKLTQLEKVALPMTLDTIQDNLFSASPNLRYVDMLMCNSTLIEDDIKAHGLAKLGIDTLKTLVYLPKEYGAAHGVNVVVNDGTGMSAETFRIVDGKDYCVPYGFDAGSVVNTRRLTGKGQAYTACLPYEVTFDPDEAIVYKPAEREGNTVTFRQVEGNTMEAQKPYVIRLTDRNATLNVDDARAIPASGGALSAAVNQWDVPGYSMRGTFDRIDNAKASDMRLMMLAGNEWTEVPANNVNAYIAPFRAYMLQSGGSSVQGRGLTMMLSDGDATGIDTIRTVDTDGTERYFDLYGRELPGKPESGIYIHNGKKIISNE